MRVNPNKNNEASKICKQVASFKCICQTHVDDIFISPNDKISP